MLDRAVALRNVEDTLAIALEHDARRRAVVTAIQRISDLLTALNAEPGAGDRADLERRLREEVDLLWRTALRRRTQMDPLDEVRTAMAAFDETIYRVVPRVYRTLDAAERAALAAAFPAWVTPGA